MDDDDAVMDCMRRDEIWNDHIAHTGELGVYTAQLPALIVSKTITTKPFPIQTTVGVHGE